MLPGGVDLRGKSMLPQYVEHSDRWTQSDVREEVQLFERRAKEQYLSASETLTLIEIINRIKSKKW